MDVKNVGFERLISIESVWSGIDDVEVILNNTEFKMLTVSIDFRKIKDIKVGKQGEIKLIYKNVLNQIGEVFINISMSIQKHNDYTYYILQEEIRN